MRLALIPIRFTVEAPTESGTYLTDAGELYFRLETRSFYFDKDGVNALNLAVTYWFKQTNVYTKEDLDAEYVRGYFDGKKQQKTFSLY